MQGNTSKITSFFTKNNGCNKLRKKGKKQYFKLIVLLLHIAISKAHNYMNHYEGTPVHPATTNMAQ